MVDVSPARIDLGNLVDGAPQAIERALALANTSDSPLMVDLAAGADLGTLAAVVGFRELDAADGPYTAHGVAVGAAAGERDEDANMLELEMLAAGYGGDLGSIATGTDTITVTVPARGSVRVLLSLIPLASRHEAGYIGAVSKPRQELDQSAGESRDLPAEDESTSEDEEGGLDGPVEEGVAEITSREQGQQYALQPLRGSVHVSWRDDGSYEGAGGVEGRCVVDVRGQRCVSRLHVDANDLVFDRCAPGKRYVKDFSIWNSSEIETCFHVSLADPGRQESLQLLDYETGDRIVSDRIDIAPFGNHRIVVAFVASEESVSGTSSAWDVLWLAVENISDSTNVLYVKVATFTTKEVAGSGLEVSCGDKILFGDCFAWEPVSRDITLRNTLQIPLSITLSSTLPNEVSFEVTSLGGRTRNKPLRRPSGRDSANISESMAEEGDDENITSDLAFQESGDGAEPSGGEVSRDMEGDADSDDVREDDASGENRQHSKRLSFHAGESFSVRVWYTPVRSPAGPDLAGRLYRRTFQVVFGQSSTESRLISAEARVCESIVTLGARELNMGDCDVLKSFNASLTLFNLSDMPTVVAVECESKCITAAVESVRIEARQSFDLGLVFVPRTLNPEYVKEIKFINKSNRRHGCSVVTLTANNVDRRCISLHAVFYKVLDPGLTNEVKFGRIAANYPAIRVVRFQNVSNQVLVLGFDDTDGVTTFAPRWNMRKRTPIELRRINSAQDSLSPSSSLVQSALRVDPTRIDSTSPSALQLMASPRKSSSSVSRTIMSLVDTDLLTTLNSMEDSLDSNPSLSEHVPVRSSRPRCGLGDSEDFASFIRSAVVVDSLPHEECDVDFGKVSSGLCADREELIQQWMEQDFVPLSLQVSGVLSGMKEEMKWAEGQLRPGRSLVHYINSGSIVRSNHLVLSPGEESVLLVAIVVGEDAVSRRAVEHSLKVRLLEFDSTRLERRAKACAWRGAMFSDTSFEDPPPREVVLSVHVCRSPVKIRPLQILNFGVMTAGMQRHRHFVIDNSDSNAGLVFSIRKTRSVASDDIRLGNGFDSGRLGAVRPFSVATIPFVFRPSLAGAFREEVVVSNAMDSSASQTLTVKATVLKRWSFHVLTQSLTDFGVLEFGSESAHALRFDVHNDTDKARKFSVSVIDRRRSSASVPLPTVLISVVEKSPSFGNGMESGESSIELAAKRSKLEHYLKKGKAAKAEAIRRDIASLEAKMAESAAVESGDSPSLPADPRSLFDSPSDTKLASRNHVGRLPGENFISFYVEGGSQTTIEVSLRVDRLCHGRSQSISTWADFGSSLPSHVRARSLLEAADLSVSTDRLESFGLPKAGQFKFTLGVFETKNRETCHSINCTTFVTAPIPRSESTLDNSELFIPRKDFPLGPPAQGFVAAAASAAVSAASNAASAAAKAIRPFGVTLADDGKDTLQPNSTFSGAVSSPQPLPRVDFGTLQLGVAERRPIQIRNTSNRYAEYVSVVPNTADGSDGVTGDAATLQDRAQTAVEISGLDKALAPGEIYTFFVSFIALAPGQHARSLILKPVVTSHSNEEEAHRLILSGFCVKGEVVTIHTESIDQVSIEGTEATVPGRVNAGQELHLGYGVVDPARDYAIVKVLSARSEVDVDVHLTARSNLSGQVLVFTDANLSVSAENVLIHARDTLQLWIAVAPRLRKSEVRDGVVRKLVGGLQLSTRGVDGSRLAESTLRFSASAGASHFSVQPRFVDLGVCPQLENPDAGVFLTGAVMLNNKSVGGDSRFEVETTSDRIFLEPPLEGILGPKESVASQKNSGQSPPERAHPSYQEVRFQLLCKGRGFIREIIHVKNLLSPSLSYSVPVSAFVDPGIFESYVDGSPMAVASFQVYLNVADNSWTVCHGGQHVWTVVAKGCAKDVDSFVPMSNLLLQVSPTNEDTGGFQSPLDDCELVSENEGVHLGGWDTPYRVCGRSLGFDSALHPGLQRKFSVNLLPPTRLSVREGALLRSGRNFTVEGGIIIREGLRSAFEDDTSGVMLQRVHLNYCVSQLAFGQSASLSTSSGIHLEGRDKLKDSDSANHSEMPANAFFTSDIGEFGLCSGWKEQHVTVTVSNPGDAWLEFGLGHLPPGFTLTQLGNAEVLPSAHDELSANSAVTSRWHKLDAMQSIVIGLRIDPAKVKQDQGDGPVGRVSIQVKIVNRMNPSGGLTWKIVGRLTSPRLQFDGLDKIRRSRVALATRSVLSMPDLQIPGSVPSAASFRVKNVSDARVSLDVKYEQSAREPESLSGAGSAIVELVDVDISEGISGVDLRKATLNPGEVLNVCVTAVPQSHENERAILDAAFTSSESIERLLGLLRFTCLVAGASEPSEIVHVRLALARGESIVAQPKELSLNRLLSREKSAVHRGRDIEPSAAELRTHMQVVTLSNRLGQTDVGVWMKVVGVPSGTTPVLVPYSAWIEPSSSIDVRIGLATSVTNRSALYGAATLLIFDKQSVCDGDAPPLNAEPIASVELHIHANENDEEDATESQSALDTFDDQRGRPADLASGAKLPVQPVTSMLDRDASHEHSSRPSNSEMPDSLGVPSSGKNAAELSLAGVVPSDVVPGLLSSSHGLALHTRESDTSLPADLLQRNDSAHSQLAIKGCAQVAEDLNRFELNCGQFSPSSEPYIRRLSLENRSSAPIEYKCIRIRARNSAVGIGDEDSRAEEDSWLTVSRSGGVLAPSGERGGSQVLVLTMLRNLVNVYSAYLVFEAGDGCEVKTVRLLMEVVADGATPGVADSYFSVLCDGRGADSRFIDYNTIIFGQLYRHRSFVIRNNSAITLEFMLASDLPETLRSELTFSLTNAVLRKTSRVIVPPKSRLRVFLLYRPMVEQNDSTEAGLIRRNEFNVRVTCRLVKDYQGNVRIISECRRQSLACSRNDFLFDCADLVHSIVQPSSDLSTTASKLAEETSDSRSDLAGCALPRVTESHGNSKAPSTSSADVAALGDSKYPVKPACGLLEIRNCCINAPLVFCIRNPTRFFEVDCAGEMTLPGSADEDGASKMLVTLRPNLERIRDRAHSLLREKYVEEHISVYNMRFPREFFWIRIRLAIGGAAMEFSAVTHKRAFAFSTLESTIANFLAQFAAFWAQFRRDDFTGLTDAPSASGSDADSHVDSSAGPAFTPTSTPSRSVGLKAWAHHVQTAPQKPGYEVVRFELMYCTDELIYYCLKNPSPTGMQMASMLYSYVFKHDVFATFLLPEGQDLEVPEMMLSWVGQLGHFLSFFPDKRDAFRGLTELEDRFRARIDPVKPGGTTSPRPLSSSSQGPGNS